MNPGGDAAEEVVRMSLEGVEVAAKISGEGAKLIAVNLVAALRSEQKTKGKARLSSMLKSGKPLKVYEIRQDDLKMFAKEAKRYGVLYCVLKDKSGKSETVDVISRVEDASKIQRITERFKLAAVNTADVKSDVEKSKALPDRVESEKKPMANPSRAQAEGSRLSAPDSKQADRSSGMTRQNYKPSVRESVREKLAGYRAADEKVRVKKEKQKER